jgi:hypothetical protein
MVETIAVRLFSETAFNTLGHGALLFWDFLASRYDESTIVRSTIVRSTIVRWTSSFGMSFGWLSISVPDAAGTGSNTALYVDTSRARVLAEKARISRGKLLAAYNARFDDTREKFVFESLRA